MDKLDIISFIENQTIDMISNTFSDNAINNAFEEHLRIQSVLPIRHRVLGGLYQSINIKFGNFLEILLKKIIDDSAEYTLVTKINTSMSDLKPDINIPMQNVVNGGQSSTFIISKRNQRICTAFTISSSE